MWVWLGGQGKSNVHMQDLSTSKVLLTKMKNIINKLLERLRTRKNTKKLE